MTTKIVPHSLRDAPALIERLLPVQKLSAEVFRERKAAAGQTLVPLGAYWKGRKPLILNKACLLGCLLPATDDPAEDLRVFELLMGMDDASFAVRWKRRPSPKDVLCSVPLARVNDYFVVEPLGALPMSSPVSADDACWENVTLEWRSDVSELERRQLEAEALPLGTYRDRVAQARRPEEVGDVHDHVWQRVNRHLGTAAESFPELLEQLGNMRFGHRPRIADTFAGSGQIPFEASRLGAEVLASDLNPVACMLSWAGQNIVGASPETRRAQEAHQQAVVDAVTRKLDALGIEDDGQGWRAKAFLSCLEVTCPQTGWSVPLLPSRLISYGKRAIAVLVPDPDAKRYDIVVRCGVPDSQLEEARKTGTLRSDGRGRDPYLVHTVAGREYRTKFSTLRGDYRANGGSGNALRLWEKADFRPRTDDILRERLYCVQWMRPIGASSRFEFEFRTVGEEDLRRERIVEDYVASNLASWQARGWVPDMAIEEGDKTSEPIRTRGWTHWHHLFPARHLLLFALIREETSDPNSLVMLSRVLNYAGKLCIWSTSKPGSAKAGEGGRTGGGSDNPVNVFYNQAINPLFNYGVRASGPLLDMFNLKLKVQPVAGTVEVRCHPADRVESDWDIYITDPPYGDAVKYEEILEYFVAWLRKNPPREFSEWTWDSRRSLAIKGEDESFRQGMVTAYRRMAERMPDNGLQVVMFTHQSGSLWADMANIVWASGLQVTAAWYVVTETDSPLRDGSFVKGTVLLVLRKRHGKHKTTRDDLAWEIQEEVEAQVAALTGLNQDARGLYRDENVFEDADLQMAGYAAALRVLTKYSVIDGRDMTVEAIRPRVKGETTFVDGLIEFAVDTANQCLVPQGVTKALWDKLLAAERFYLKMLDLEARGASSLDNYQNFAKAFKVRDFRALMADQRANQARLRSAIEFGKAEMSEASELSGSVLRAALFAVMELQSDIDGTDVLMHLSFNVPNYYGDMTQRERVVEIADFLARRLDGLRPEEASAARVLRELVRNQRLG